MSVLLEEDMEEIKALARKVGIRAGVRVHICALVFPLNEEGLPASQELITTFGLDPLRVAGCAQAILFIAEDIHEKEQYAKAH